MPFQYERDDDRHRLIFTFTGPFLEQDGQTLLDMYKTEDVAGYGVIYDLRDQTGSPTMEELRSFASAESTTVPMPGFRGPVAVIAGSNARMYNMACAYAALARPKVKIAVFTERSDADVWLAAELPWLA